MLENIIKGKVILNLGIKSACIAYGIYLGVSNYNSFKELKNTIKKEYTKQQYEKKINLLEDFILGEKKYDEHID